jgi:uncharacterized protein YacL
MSNFLRGVKLPPNVMRVSDPIRLGLLVVFGILGSVGFGKLAIPLLNTLSNEIAKLFGTRTIAQSPGYPDWLKIAPFALLGLIFGGFVGNVLTTACERLIARWKSLDLGAKINIFVGTFIGLIASINIFSLFQNTDISGPAKFGILIGLAVALGFLVSYALSSISEYLPWTSTKGKVRRTGIKIMDTNIIIDGRIYDIVRSGFLDGQLYVPGFVLDELQYIADSHDQLRRQRGRRGLEVLRHMQADFSLDVKTHDKLAPDLQDGVDARLVRLAKAIGGDILTNDFNLKRVAELQDVQVLSLNDLALALRPNVLPQETLAGLKIVREGNQYGQGIGYLEDGTMVVVENGMASVGETRDVLVTQVIQTERGKMIFAEIESNGTSPEHRAPSRRRRPV